MFLDLFKGLLGGGGGGSSDLDPAELIRETAMVNRPGMIGPSGGYEYGYVDANGNFQAGFNPDQPAVVRSFEAPAQAQMTQDRTVFGGNVQNALIAMLSGGGGIPGVVGRDGQPAPGLNIGTEGWKGLFGTAPPQGAPRLGKPKVKKKKKDKRAGAEKFGPSTGDNRDTPDPDPYSGGQAQYSPDFGYGDGYGMDSHPI